MRRQDPVRRRIGQSAKHARETGVCPSCHWLAHLCLLLSAILCGCGYKVAGRASTLPEQVHTIAVPAFTNQTQRYRIEQRVTEAVIREFLSASRYRIVSNPDDADAVLHGQILGLETSPVIFDPVTGHATSMLVQMRFRVRLEQRGTSTLLYHNDNYIFRQEYQISSDVPSFFDEQDPALDRMARDFASRLVADILENF